MPAGAIGRAAGTGERCLPESWARGLVATRGLVGEDDWVGVRLRHSVPSPRNASTLEGEVPLAAGTRCGETERA